MHKSQQPFTDYLLDRFLVYPEVLVMVCRVLWFIFILYHYIFIRMTDIQNHDNIKCQWGYGATRNSHSLLIGIQNGTATLEDSLEAFYKTKHALFIYLFLN